MTIVNMSRAELEMIKFAIDHGITDKAHLANFMAQVTHESIGLTRLEEGFRYTQSIDHIPVQSAFREGRGKLEEARQDALKGKPEALAELMYGNRLELGNAETGDGYTFRGRGYIQLTGRANYEYAGKDLGLDLVNHPDLAAKPENARQIAMWYWDERVAEHHKGDVTAVCRDINGKLNGLEDRKTRFTEWEQKLSPELIEKIGMMTQEDLAEVKTYSGLLRVGSRGEEVTQLQETLNALGYTSTKGQPLVVDGDFGQNTKQAVEAFQRANGLGSMVKSEKRLWKL